MAVDTDVYHILTVTGFSSDSFDEAAKNAVEGAWENHHEEFARFVEYSVKSTGGNIDMVDGSPVVEYSATVAISAVHKPHKH